MKGDLIITILQFIITLVLQFAYQPSIGVDDAVTSCRDPSHLEDTGNTMTITFFEFPGNNPVKYPLPPLHIGLHILLGQLASPEVVRQHCHCGMCVRGERL